MSEGANAAGAALAGALPHRGVGGQPLSRAGRDARAMIESPRAAYVLFGVEPSQDLAAGAEALEALRAAKVVALHVVRHGASCYDVADVLLPIGYLRRDRRHVRERAKAGGKASTRPPSPSGEARPGWRVLRVLGNELELPDCEYRTPSDVSAALEHELGGRLEIGAERYRRQLRRVGSRRARTPSMLGELDVPIYAVDALVRRSEPLQLTELAQRGVAV